MVRSQNPHRNPTGLGGEQTGDRHHLRWTSGFRETGPRRLPGGSQPRQHRPQLSHYIQKCWRPGLGHRNFTGWMRDCEFIKQYKDYKASHFQHFDGIQQYSIHIGCLCHCFTNSHKGVRAAMSRVWDWSQGLGLLQDLREFRARQAGCVVPTVPVVPSKMAVLMR